MEENETFIVDELENEEIEDFFLDNSDEVIDDILKDIGEIL